MGLSNGFKKQAGMYALISGTCMVLLNRYNGVRIQQNLKKVLKCTEEIWDTNFGPQLYSSKYEETEIAKKTVAFDEIAFGAQNRIDNPKVLLSTILGLLDYFEQVIKDPVKRADINFLQDRLYKAYQYFDRDVDDFISHEKANKAIDIWMDIFDDAIKIKINPLTRVDVAGGVFKVDTITGFKKRVCI